MDRLNIEDELNDFSFFNEELNRQLMEDSDEMTDWLIENTNKRFDHEEQRAQEAADKQKELNRQKLEAAGAFAQEGFALFSAFQEREIQAIELKLRTNEQNEKQSDEEKKKTEEKLLAERAKILTKQAKLDKSAALIAIAINTAVAISRVSPVVPLMILAGVFGAAQAAVVLAQPIPQFAKGTDASPEGLAITGEKGRELKISPKGKMSLTSNKASLDYLQKGTKIVPADITEQFLRFAAVANGFEGKADDQSILMMMDKLDGIKQAIKSKPVTSSRLTPEGILTATHLGNTTLIKRKRFYT